MLQYLLLQFINLISSHSLSIFSYIPLLSLYIAILSPGHTPPVNILVPSRSPSSFHATFTSDSLPVFSIYSSGPDAEYHHPFDSAASRCATFQSTKRRTSNVAVVSSRCDPRLYLNDFSVFRVFMSTSAVSRYASARFLERCISSLLRQDSAALTTIRRPTMSSTDQRSPNIYLNLKNVCLCGRNLIRWLTSNFGLTPSQFSITRLRFHCSPVPFVNFVQVPILHSPSHVSHPRAHSFSFPTATQIFSSATHA